MLQPLTSLKVTSEIPKNRLNITIAGELSKNDMEKLYSAMKFCVADLQPGFHVVTDIRECKFGQLSAIPTLRKIMNYLIGKGVAEIVRIVQKESLIFRQAINFAFMTQGYKPVYVYSLEEAETLLGKTLERDGLRLRLHNHEIIYVLEGQENKGQIFDISTSGCAIETEWQEALKNQELLLKLTFTQNDQAPTFFEISAKVVRQDGYLFAVKFLNLGPEEKEKLWDCLLYEIQRGL